MSLLFCTSDLFPSVVNKIKLVCFVYILQKLDGKRNLAITHVMEDVGNILNILIKVIKVIQ